MRTCHFILTALTTVSTFATAMEREGDWEPHQEVSNRMSASQQESIPANTIQDIRNAIEVYKRSIEFYREMDPWGINKEFQEKIRNAEKDKRKLENSLIEALGRQLNETLKVTVQEEPQTVDSINESILALETFDPNGNDREIQRQISSLKAQKRSLVESSVPTPAPVADDRDEALARQLNEEFAKQRAIQVVNVQEEPQTVDSINESILALETFDPNGKDRTIQSQILNLKSQLANLQNNVISPADQIKGQNREYEEALRQDQRKTRVQELTTQNEQIEKDIQKLQGQIDEASALFERNNKELIDEVNRLKQALEIDQARATLYQQYNTLNATPSRASRLSQLETDLTIKKEQFTETQQKIRADLKALNGKKESVQRDLQNLQ